MRLFTAEHPTSADYRRDALIAVDRLMALRQRLEEAGPLPPELAPLIADVAAGLNDVESFWFAIGQALALHDPRSGAA